MEKKVVTKVVKETKRGRATEGGGYTTEVCWALRGWIESECSDKGVMQSEEGSR